MFYILIWITICIIFSCSFCWRMLSQTDTIKLHICKLYISYKRKTWLVKWIIVSFKSNRLAEHIAYFSPDVKYCYCTLQQCTSYKYSIYWIDSLDFLFQKPQKGYYDHTQGWPPNQTAIFNQCKYRVIDSFIWYE